MFKTPATKHVTGIRVNIAPVSFFFRVGGRLKVQQESYGNFAFEAHTF